MTTHVGTDREILGVAEICAELKVHENTVYRWIAEEGFPAIRVGGRKWGVRRAAMDWWLDQRRGA